VQLLYCTSNCEHCLPVIHAMSTTMSRCSRGTKAKRKGNFHITVDVRVSVLSKCTTVQYLPTVHAVTSGFLYDEQCSVFVTLVVSSPRFERSTVKKWTGVYSKAIVNLSSFVDRFSCTPSSSPPNYSTSTTILWMIPCLAVDGLLGYVLSIWDWKGVKWIKGVSCISSAGGFW